jgi:hypothetical protein
MCNAMHPPLEPVASATRCEQTTNKSVPIHSAGRLNLDGIGHRAVTKVAITAGRNPGEAIEAKALSRHFFEAPFGAVRLAS